MDAPGLLKPSQQIPTALRILALSAHVGCALLLLKLARSLRLHRQLKHRSLLSLTKERQEYDLTIRKLQCIVMGGDSLLVDLALSRSSLSPPAPKNGNVTSHACADKRAEL